MSTIDDWLETNFSNFINFSEFLWKNNFSEDRINWEKSSESSTEKHRRNCSSSQWGNGILRGRHVRWIASAHARSHGWGMRARDKRNEEVPVCTRDSWQLTREYREIREWQGLALRIRDIIETGKEGFDGASESRTERAESTHTCRLTQLNR